ncbi:MAG: TonB-dependent receptor, partial [Prevotellaceae bacterium]|nr:TonB-dependent receptor [Candidatus Faecinaster equi]
ANKDLKATTNHKLEFSLNGSHKKQSFNITAFYEHCNNDFGFSSVYLTTPFKLYEVPTGVQNIEYKKHAVYCDGKEANSTNNWIFNTYSQPNNRIKARKKGIEYSLNLGEISALKTSIVIDGAYIWIKRTSAATSMSVLGYSKGERYPYLPIYPAGNGSISDRFNTNVRFITHIPKLKMIFSTTAQIVWRETARNIYEDSDGNNIYYLEHNAQTRPEGSYYVDPIKFYDKDGVCHEWKEEYRDLTTRECEMRMSSSVKPNEYGKESYPTTILFNFRITKELGKMMELSFLANNVFKFSKYFQRTTSSGYTQLMIPLYFGAEMKLKF